MKINKLVRILMIFGILCLWHSISYAQSPDTLRLQAFYQGASGNCVSVALIKAAIDRYGIHHVFDTLRTGNSVKISLRDKKTVFDITDAERNQAAAAAKFVSNDDKALPNLEQKVLISYANLCYAVIAKYLQTQGEWGCLGATEPEKPQGNFTDALANLDNGICGDNCYHNLGLTVVNPNNVDYNTTLDFTDKKGVVVYSDKHAVFLFRNRFDFHGDWIKCTGKAQCITRRFKSRYYWVLS